VRAVLRNQQQLAALPDNGRGGGPNTLAYRFITGVLVAVVAVSLIAVWLFLSPRSFDLLVRFVLKLVRRRP
jgi:hypothetical protein